MPRVKHVTRQTARNVERQRQAWELRRQGASFTEIGRALGVSRVHASRLIQREIDIVSDEVSGHVEAYRIEEIARTEIVMRESMRILTTNCRVCEGRGLIKPDGPVTLPGEEDECSECSGTGKRYGVDWRLKSQDRILKAIEIRAKLLGLYSPERHEIVTEAVIDDTLSREIATLDDEELNRVLAGYMTKISAETTPN